MPRKKQEPVAVEPQDTMPAFYKIPELPDNFVDLKLYSSRIEEAQAVFGESYKRVIDSRNAYDDRMPQKEREDATPRRDPREPNPSEGRSSVIYPPFLSTTIKLRMETMLANAPALQLAVGDATAPQLQQALNKKTRDLYSTSRISMKTQEIYKRAEIDGICCCQIVAPEAGDILTLDDGSKIQTSEFREVDIKIYDTLGVCFDPNASPYDIRKTARWAVVTLGYFTPAYIYATYGVDLRQRKGDKDSIRKQIEHSTATIGNSHMKTTDMAALGLSQQDGKASTNMIPVREYYLRGSYYLIIADEFVIPSHATQTLDRIPQNGATTELPLIFVVLDTSVSGTFGKTLHEAIRPLVEPIAALINIGIDNLWKNLTAPIFSTLPNLDQVEIPFENFNKIVSLGTLQPGIDLQKAFYQPTFSFEPQVFMQLLQELKGMLAMVTRVNDLSFGMQEKQIRNEAAANLLGSSQIRNSSYIVLMFEHSFINPFAKDFLRLLMKYFDALGGLVYTDEEGQHQLDISELMKIRSVTVENGSMLESSQQTRLQRAATMLNLTMVPNVAPILKVKEIIREFLEASGIPGYAGIMKNINDILDEQALIRDMSTPDQQ